jgi:protein SCO1/2
VAVLIAVLSAVAGVSIWKLAHSRGQDALLSLLVLPDPRLITDFRLTDHHSRAFELSGLEGKWSLLFFGFTNCPDVCPQTLFELQKVNAELKQHQGVNSEKLQILFISVDPERDTAASIEQYLANFDAGFIGLRGDHWQLAPLTRQLGIAYQTDSPAPENHDTSKHEHGQPRYDVAHSASIMVVDPQMRLYGVFPAPHDAQKISTDLLAIMKE